MLETKLAPYYNYLQSNLVVPAAELVPATEVAAEESVEANVEQ